MYHLIEFLVSFTADLEVSPRQRLEQIQIRKGSRFRVHLRPYVMETSEGPVEMADVCFDDGTVTRGVSYEHFRFVDE